MKNNSKLSHKKVLTSSCRCGKMFRLSSETADMKLENGIDYQITNEFKHSQFLECNREVT